MHLELTQAQRDARAEFREFVAREIAPYAGQWDRSGAVPAATIARIRSAGYLGALAPRASGGRALDFISYGLLHEAIGTACSSVRSLLTVHDMVSHGVARWASEALRHQLVPQLASGAKIGAFCLTESAAGSDPSGMEATIEREDDEWLRLTGTKRWITFGQIADVFLVFGRWDGRHVAVLVDRHSPGVDVHPIGGMLGCRASMLAEVRFSACRVPRNHLLGGVGFGLSGVAQSCLDLGRYSVAWGCVGLAQACLEASIQHALERRQSGRPLADHQLVRRLLTDMVTSVNAGRWLCLSAGYLKDQGDPRTVTETFIAKYFASTTAMRVASDAVQVHGAIGCSEEKHVERFLRDAKVMEIIEGSTEVQQDVIARLASQEYMRRAT